MTTISYIGASAQAAPSPRADVDCLVQRLHTAISRGDTRLALTVMCEISARLEKDHADTPRLVVRRAGAWCDEDEGLCAGLDDLYIRLARAGTTVFETLRRDEGVDENRVELARRITLEWFRESAHWQRMRAFTQSRHLQMAA